MKIINKINPRISAFKFKDEVRGFLTNNQLKNEKILWSVLQTYTVFVFVRGQFGNAI